MKLAYIHLLSRIGLSDNCSPNIFMAMDRIGASQIATIETVYFNYPLGNLIIIGRPDPRLNEEIAFSKGYCLTFREIDEAFYPELNKFIRTQFFIYTLQHQFGGIYIPFDGGLVNTLEYVAPPGTNFVETSMFQEIITSSSPDTFGRDDFESMIWPRSWMDRHEGGSMLCSVHCIRFVYKGDDIGEKVMIAFLSTGVHPDMLLTRFAKPRLETTLIVLPSWLIAETKFPDHWNTFGSTPGYTNPSTDLHAPREHRYRQDYWLVVSNKLWIPWLAGSGEELNTLDLSVSCLIKQQFSLEIFSDHYSPIFSKSKEQLYDVKIKSPLDQIERLMTQEQILMRKHFHVRDIGLPGPVGGYRTFRHLKVISKISPYVHVTVGTDNVPFVCKIGNKYCQEYLTSNGTFDICDSPALVNAALSELMYSGLPPEENVNFFNISVTAQGTDTCGEVVNLIHVTNFTALALDPHTSVTVIAHSAERCFLLNRMMNSIHQVYPSMQGIVTCECDTSSDDCPSEPQLDSRQHSMNTDWYLVPYDFGLSRGKQFSITQVLTRYILVLDDDFVLSFNSCIECLMWRMESKMHSAAWLPLDIVGFPVLEDERSFGAFRGTLRVSDSKFFVEPFTHQSTPDGCARVDICPMVFLGRASRMKLAIWNNALPVGEHEQFFYANKYQGLQVAVCSDTSFVHLRLNATLSENYAARRGRMRELMSDTFSNVGLGQTYYFFHKYSHADYHDFEQLASKGINPYTVPNDGGGPRDVTFGTMKLAYIAIISGTDDFSRERRMHFRQKDGVLGMNTHTGIIQYAFFVPAHARGDSSLMNEFDEFNDIVWFPSKQSIQLKYIAEFFRRYLFQFIILIDEKSDFLETQSGLTTLSSLTSREMAFHTSPNLVVMSRDLHAIVSDPINLKRLRTMEGNNTIFTSSELWSNPYILNIIPL